MSAFDLAAHGWLAVIVAGVGAALWTFDDFLAERYKASREMDFAPFAISDPEQETSGREEYSERHAKSARLVGYIFMGVGALLGIAWLARLILTP